jgi:hypothetical protein
MINTITNAAWKKIYDQCQPKGNVLLLEGTDGICSLLWSTDKNDTVSFLPKAGFDITKAEIYPSNQRLLFDEATSHIRPVDDGVTGIHKPDWIFARQSPAQRQPFFDKVFGLAGDVVLLGPPAKIFTKVVLAEVEKHGMGIDAFNIDITTLEGKPAFWAAAHFHKKIVTPPTPAATLPR